MKLTIDPEADALYLRLNDAKIVDSQQVASGVVLDYDAHDNVVGVEMLHLSQESSESGSPTFTLRKRWEFRRARS